MATKKWIFVVNPTTIEIFRLPFYMVTKTFWSTKKGGMSHVFRKPLSKAFQKHMTCPLVWQLKKIWSLSDNGGVLDADLKVVIQTHLQHRMATKCFWSPRRACWGLFFFKWHYMSPPFLVATLALGLWPRQGVARLGAKRETRESLHMLQGVQRVWGNEPSHSQMNSHVGSWTPKRTPKFSKRNFKGQNSLPWRVLYIIEKLLKLRCLIWAHIAHLDIWNTSYGQKKGRESNWHFDSQPLKVRNRPDFLACR
jgi:hypothetical protein